MMKLDKRQKRLQKLYEDLTNICNEFLQDGSLTEVVGALEGCKAILINRNAIFKEPHDE